MERLRRLRIRDASRATAANGTETLAPAEEPRASAETDFNAAVQVVYGASVQALPLVGLRVADARPLVESILRIDPRSPAVINGRQVRPDHVIARGDVLEFVHHAGEKGRCAWTSVSRSPAAKPSATRMAARRLPHR